MNGACGRTSQGAAPQSVGAGGGEPAQRPRRTQAALSPGAPGVGRVGRGCGLGEKESARGCQDVVLNGRRVEYTV